MQMNITRMRSANKNKMKPDKLIKMGKMQLRKIFNRRPHLWRPSWNKLTRRRGGRELGGGWADYLVKSAWKGNARPHVNKNNIKSRYRAPINQKCMIII